MNKQADRYSLKYIEDWRESKSIILYSWKYWRELNLAAGSHMAICNCIINLAAQYGIAIPICIFLADFNLAVAKADRQTAKFSGYTVIYN